MGHGDGQGDAEGGIVAGSAVSVGLTVFMCLCGIPMIIAGAVLIVLHKNADDTLNIGWMMTVGIVLIVISGVLLVGGIILIVLLCTGVIGSKTRQPATSAVIVHPSQQMGVYPQPVPLTQGEPPFYQQGGSGAMQEDKSS